MRQCCFSWGLLGLALFLAPLSARAGDAEWPGWRGPNRDGKSPDKGLLDEWPPEGPKLLWKFDKLGKGFSTVAVSKGRVYSTGDRDGNLKIFAFDMSGNPVWEIDHDKAWTGDPGGSRSTPTISDGNLYLISGHGLVGCYDAKSGKQVWTASLRDLGGDVPGWGYAESVLILGNAAVVTPGGKNCIAALDKKTGKTLWTSKGFDAGANYSSCVAFNYEKIPLIVNGTGGGIVCVSARDGLVQWSNDFSAGNTANCPTPAYSDGYVFWANGYGKGGICMKLEKGKGKVSAEEAWTTDKMDCHHGGYIIHDGYIYGNNGGQWVCLDLKTGARKWKDRGVGKGSVVFADGKLFLFGENDGLAGLGTASPSGLNMKGTFKVKGSGPSWAHPVVIGGRLYLRYDTNLYCFDVKGK